MAQTMAHHSDDAKPDYKPAYEAQLAALTDELDTLETSIAKAESAGVEPLAEAEIMDVSVRNAKLRALCELELHRIFDFATHAAALAAELKDANAYLAQAVRTLPPLAPEEIRGLVATFSAALASELEQDANLNIEQAGKQVAFQPNVLLKWLWHFKYFKEREPIEHCAELRPLTARLEAIAAYSKYIPNVVRALEKLAPEDLQPHAETLAAKLGHSDREVCTAVVRTLRKLAPADLQTHAAALMAILEDTDAPVDAVAETLGKLTPKDLQTHAAALVAKLEDSDAEARNMAKVAAWRAPMRAALQAAIKITPIPQVREELQGLEEEWAREDAAAKEKASRARAAVAKAVAYILGKLAPEDLAMHAAALVATLGDSDVGVRNAALETLGKLAPEDLAMHAAALVATLGDSDVGVRNAAQETLGKLAPEDLAMHAAALVAKLEDSDNGVRKAALEILGKLTPEDLATHATHAVALVAKLGHSDLYLRTMMIRTLGKLTPEDLATHTDVLIAALQDNNQDVRRAAAQTFVSLDYMVPEVLATQAHLDALVAKLLDKNQGVREAVQQTLDKMPPDMLAMLTKLALFFSRSPLWPCLLGVLHAMDGERGATEDFIKAEIQDEKLDKLEAGMPAGGKRDAWLKWSARKAAAKQEML